MNPEFLRSSIITEGSNPGRLLFISDGPIEKQHEDDDCFILSFTKTFDRDAMIQFGYDVCYEIREPFKFIDAISKRMKKIGKFEYLEECTYTGRYIEHTEGLDHRASLLKEKKHSYQNEIRAVWKPFHKKIKPFIGSFSESSNYLYLKANPLIGEVTEHYFETENAYLEAIEYIEGYMPPHNEISRNTSIHTGKDKVVYYWKDKPVITFGRIREEKYESPFIYNTYSE